MDVNLWISVALAIPLSIAGNLFTPTIKRQFDNYTLKNQTKKASKKLLQQQKQLESARKELNDLSKFHNTPSILTNFYLIQLMYIAFYGAFSAIYVGIFGFLINLGGTLENIARLGRQLTPFLFSLLIYQTCNKTIRVHSKLKNFNEHIEKITNFIAELESSISEKTA